MADFDLSFLAKPASLLPIAKYKRSLQYAIEKYPVVIVLGQTGSGKTTQLPQYLHEAGWTSNGKIIGVTQPRTVAVTNVATRVANEMRCRLDQEVGYSIRFDDQTSQQTRVKFLTDGMLLREALADPLLTAYSVVMVDEAHERSLSSDILLGYLKIVRRSRPELRLIISSATIEAEKVFEFFNEQKDGLDICKVIALDGRTFPVDIHYLQRPTDDYVQKAVHTAISIHKEEPPGDILIFMPGREQIQRAIQSLTEYASTVLPNQQALQPLPLYAGLSQDEQIYVFSEAAENTRKVVVSTNVAEASVTIDGIVYIIDSGVVKLRIYDPASNIESLLACAISKASALQRAGRAGRTRPGKAYRLYPEATFQTLAPTTPPEIQRVNLAPVILQLKALGVDNVAQFPYLSAPSSKLMARALETLYSLGALDEYAKLSMPLGTNMAEIAVMPMMAKALLTSAEAKFNCVDEMLTIAAMTSIQATGHLNIWFSHEGQQKAMDLSRRKFAADEGDHLTYVNVFNAFSRQGTGTMRWCQQNSLSYKALARAADIRQQLKRHLQRLGIGCDDHLSRTHDSDKHDVSTQILRCLTSGYFANAARMNEATGTFIPVSGEPSTSVLMHAHPTSLLFNRKADYVIFHELLETGDKVYIKDITKIDRNWLLELGSGYYNVEDKK